jgi:high-affinity K+ transport system ATPase subunit B
MLTGDNKTTAKWVSDRVGRDELFAEVLSQDKAAKVKEVQSRATSSNAFGIPPAASAGIVAINGRRPKLK